jgi:hypothetical protein
MATGARIEFHGEGAGLGRVETGGDASSRANYVVFCKCDLQLGPLGKFRVDDLGRSSICCPRCQSVLIIDENAKILSVQPLKAVLAAIKR